MFEFASAAAKGFHRSSQYRAKIKTGTVSLCIEELLGTVEMDCGEGVLRLGLSQLLWLLLYSGLLSPGQSSWKKGMRVRHRY